MSIRFYNPGSRLYEKMAFDHPTNDIKQVNLIAYYQIDAAERSFFEVPSEIEVQSDAGPISVSVRFADRIQKDYREYGVVRVDSKPKHPILENENLAVNDKDAKERGDRLYRDYLEAKAREHVENVEKAYAMGAVPRRATGVYAQALKVCGLVDPADKVGAAIDKRQDSDEIALLKTQIAELQRLAKKA